MAVPMESFYPFDMNDTQLTRGSDVVSPGITLTTNFPFFNDTHNVLYVSDLVIIMYNYNTVQPRLANTTESRVHLESGKRGA